MTRETTYSGPVVVSRHTFAGLPVEIVRPGEPDRMLDDPLVHDWNHRDDYMPYWAYLWPGAFLLAEAVAREPWSDGPETAGPIEALEIGCGVGLAGMVALARGLHVCFTDYDLAPLHYVSQSAVQNGFDHATFSTRTLDWRALPVGETFAVILGSDVLYERRLVPLVAGLLAQMLAPDGLGLISCPGRTSAEGFEEALAAHGLLCDVEAIESQTEEGDWIGGNLYRVRRRISVEVSDRAAESPQECSSGA